MGLFPDTMFRRKLPVVTECGQCGLDRSCRTPKMRHFGDGRLRVLFVSEAPGRYEDETGRHLAGDAGQFLERTLKRIGVDLRADCWLDNSVMCRPPENEEPTSQQIEWCRPHLTKLIEELRPTVIIPMGGPAIESMMHPLWHDDKGYAVTRFAGWTIPCQELNSWICPTFNPAFLCHKPSPVTQMFFERHLKKAFDLCIDRPWRVVPDYKSMVRVLMTTDDILAGIRKFFDFHQDYPIAVDIETNMLKPDSAQAEIVSCALSNGQLTISYPWTPAARTATKDLITTGRPFIASNQSFEERWFLKEFGHGVDYWYRDTLLRGHWEDCRSAISGLKFQAFVKLGQGSYNDHIAPYLKSDQSNKPNRIRSIPIRDLLLYGGMDALLERNLVP